MSEDPYKRLERATAELEAPFALVDLDALWANADDLVRRAGSKPIRLASKSVRCRALQERVLARPGFAGTLAFTLPEALWLAGHDTQDLVVAYPTADRRALVALAELTAERPATRLTVMVDSIEQLDLIDRTTGARGDVPLRVCIDVDAGWWVLGGRVRVGAKRSPVHTPAQAAALARAILARDGLRLVGIMSYEAQIAGLGDTPAGRPLRARAIRALQRRSARELAVRRAAAVAAVEAVSAGGVGAGRSSSSTAAAPAASSRRRRRPRSPRLRPARGCTGRRCSTPTARSRRGLPRCSRCPSCAVPGPAWSRCWAAATSPPAPPMAARLPRPHLPAGLRLDRQEGAGEVQTPLLGVAADGLALGDRVYMRHAKAGELCERFANLYLLEGERIVEEVPTYRGEGQCFL